MKTTYKKFEIESTYVGNKQSPSIKFKNEHNSIITVTNLETGVSFEFETWGSVNEPYFETHDDLIFAFMNFLQNALLGDMDYDQCSEELRIGFSIELDEEMYEQFKAMYNKAVSVIPEYEIEILAEELHDVCF